MELRQYAAIIRRRFWLPVGLPAVVLLISLVLRQPGIPQFVASARVLVDVPPLQQVEGMGFDPRLTAPQATEYLVDDFSAFVTGDVVARMISERLAAQGFTVPAGIIQSSTSSQQVHRVVEIQLTWGDPEQARAILQTAIEVLQQEAPAYFGRLGTLQPVVRLFDGPRVAPLPPSLTQRLDLPVRLLLAVLVGVALCFLLDYLDDSVRNKSELEAMGISVLAEVPGRW
jgi:capsular polysaccharide biosynthesis protein